MLPSLPALIPPSMYAGLPPISLCGVPVCDQLPPRVIGTLAAPRSALRPNAFFMSAFDGDNAAPQPSFPEDLPLFSRACVRPRALQPSAAAILSSPSSRTRITALTHPAVVRPPAVFRPVRFDATRPSPNGMGGDQNGNLVVDERRNHAAITAPVDPVVNRHNTRSPSTPKLQLPNIQSAGTGMTSCPTAMSAARTCTRSLVPTCFNVYKKIGVYHDMCDFEFALLFLLPRVCRVMS